MAKRNHKYWLIKNHLFYTTKEICSLLKVDESTVRRWCRNGLTFSGKNPKIFRGVEIKEFVRRMIKSHKRPLAERQCYCVKCHKRFQVENQNTYARYIDKGYAKYRIETICTRCGCKTRRFSSIREINEWIERGWLLPEQVDLRLQDRIFPTIERFEKTEKKGGKDVE